MQILFLSSALYFISAILSIALIRWHKLCNVVCNAFCIAASLSGIISSLFTLISGDGQLSSIHIPSNIPFFASYIKIDYLSAYFLLALSILVFCVSVYSLGYLSHYYRKRNVGLFHFLNSTFILSMIYVIVSGNALFFLVAWEAMSLLSYFLVIFESEREENLNAGLLYIIMTHIGTAFLLIAFMIMFKYTGTFNIFVGSEIVQKIPVSAQNAMFILFLLGFGTKAGVIPLHIWLPRAHPAAPSNVSALMSGIMIKTAIYGLIRFLLCYLHIQQTWWGVAILCVGIISAVIGVSYALMEHNIKRLLAFHSVENIGIILIGLGVCLIATSQNNEFLASLALIASLFHTFNHALFKSGLFLGAGSIQYATHTKDIEEMGGLIKKMPVTALFVLCFSLAICAIVPFNGFVSEWLTYQSRFRNITSYQTANGILYVLSAAALALAGALAAACFVKLFGISFLGSSRSEHALKAKEVPVPMLIGMGLLALCCAVFGIFPITILYLVDKVTAGILGQSIMEQLQGGLFFVNAPIHLFGSGSSIHPLVVLSALVVTVVLVLAVIRLIGGKVKERKYGTWDCGFERLSPRMQYSATGFSKPLRIVFRALYRPSRELVVKEGKSPYFPEGQTYRVTTESIIEKYLYHPFHRIIRNVSGKIRFLVQTGSIHAYLIYIFVAILALMLYNRLA